MDGMGEFHQKALCFINVAMFYQYKHWYNTKNSFMIYLKQTPSDLLKLYPVSKVTLLFVSIDCPKY